MFDQQAKAFTAALRGLDVTEFDVAAVEAHIKSIETLRRAASAAKAKLLARSKELAEAGKGAGPRETLTRDGNTSGRSADRDTERSDTLADAPTLADSLADGDISDDHVDALADATRDLPEPIRSQLRADPTLADAARELTPRQFRRLVRRRADQARRDLALSRLERQRADTRLRAWIKPDGSIAFNGQIDAERGAAFLKRLDAEMLSLAQREGLRFDDHTRALALLALIERGAGTEPGGIPVPADVTIIDAATLADGPHDHSVCETSSGASLPSETIARHLCHARIHAIVLDDNGCVLDAGTTRRTANRAQRRALRAMYPTCAWLGCDRPFDWCQMHHIIPWEHGGPTDLADLIPLCSAHHHQVHEGRWHIALDRHRTLTITRPDGAVHAVVALPSAELARHLHTTGVQPPDPDAPRTGPSRGHPSTAAHPDHEHRHCPGDDPPPAASDQPLTRSGPDLRTGPERDPDPDAELHAGTDRRLEPADARQDRANRLPAPAGDRPDTPSHRLEAREGRPRDGTLTEQELATVRQTVLERLAAKRDGERATARIRCPGTTGR